MNEKLQEKLKTLPRSPGVYFHKSKTGEIIYVGKAAVLKNRVRQYFQSKRDMDIKTLALVAEINDTDWITTESEIDALFLESEMVKRYKPRFNILLRDDKSQLFVRINMKDAYPYVSFTRGPADDGADYYGPYYNAAAVRKALQYLRKVFPYSTHAVMPKRVCLQYHIGLCPGVEEQKVSSSDYKQSLRKLIRYLKGERKALMQELERDMKNAATEHNFELAAALRNKLNNLKELQRRIMFGDAEFLDISKDQALVGLQELLHLSQIPRRIEGYDISHMSGTNNVASMVVATNGLADKAEYRKFKMRLPGNNDFAHMHETLSRRFSGRHLDWPTPDLLLIDGGKGQLDAALRALEEKSLTIPAIGLAKREEEIIVHKTRSNVEFVRQSDSLPVGTFVGESDDFFVIRLPKDSHIVKLLQRIRNESHRFAVSYHSTLKRQGATKSLLDDIPGVGPATRKKIVTAFGSVRGIKTAKPEQIIAVVGQRQAKRIIDWLAGTK
ncbi:MAG TPA: excinuclease ABC subunit UvrC [Verrucomicrobiae bacterium]|nr:excinuclease ABC subunit UvrC [Verrucomicrobiae bacterium]